MPRIPSYSLLALLLLLTLACSLVTGAPAASPAPPSASRVPLTATLAPPYVPPECQGTPVATLPPATTAAEPTPSLAANPLLTTNEQLKVFDELTGPIAKVYVYPDFNGRDWPGIVADYRARVESGMDTETFYTEMEKLISELGDEHSRFESPAQVAATNATLAGVNDYVGIGVLVKPLLDKGRLTILSVFPNSAAEHAGLHPHDSLLAIDEVPLVEAGVAFPQRVRGPECSAGQLTVQSPPGQRRQVMIMRYKISAGQPVDARLVPTADGARIGYIFLPTFFDETIPGQVRQALEEFGPLDGLILDNRMNGGGSSSVMEPILSYFTAGTLGHFVSRKATRPLEITADPVGNSQSIPLILLVGEDTVSFGEIFSGVLQDTGRAKIVGQTTLGNVETLHGHTLSDGSQVWLAEERFDPLLSHADWEKSGIVPDVVAYADWDTFTSETDPSVAAAVKLLGH